MEECYLVEEVSKEALLVVAAMGAAEAVVANILIFAGGLVVVESVDDGQSLYITSEEALIDFLRKHKTVDYQGVSRTK